MHIAYIKYEDRKNQQIFVSYTAAFELRQNTTDDTIIHILNTYIHLATGIQKLKEYKDTDTMTEASVVEKV